MYRNVQKENITAFSIALLMKRGSASGSKFEYQFLTTHLWYGDLFYHS